MKRIIDIAQKSTEREKQNSNQLRKNPFSTYRIKANKNNGI